VKPDIVFFEEDLPDRYRKLEKSDFAKCDLLIVSGTALQSLPFANLINTVPAHCRRVLINDHRVGEILPIQVMGMTVRQIPGFVFRDSKPVNPTPPAITAISQTATSTSPVSKDSNSSGSPTDTATAAASLSTSSPPLSMPTITRKRSERSLNKVGIPVALTPAPGSSNAKTSTNKKENAQLMTSTWGLRIDTGRKMLGKRESSGSGSGSSSNSGDICGGGRTRRKNKRRDVFLHVRYSDSGFMELASLCGWGAELEELDRELTEQFETKQKARRTTTLKLASQPARVINTLVPVTSHSCCVIL